MEFNTQTGALAKWLAELPRGSIGKTAELLYKALQDISRQEIQPAERFHIMETIREPVHYVTENMRSHFVKMTIPAPEKTILTINACRAFYDGMAAGYQMIVTDTGKSPGLFADDTILATSMHRGLSYIGLALLTAYEVYATSHHDNWTRLHTLYSQAEQAGLTDVQVVNQLDESMKQTRIIDEYLRILLLSLTSPYNLRQGEIGKIYRYLEPLTELVTLERIVTHDAMAPVSMPTVNLATDYPPEYADIPAKPDNKCDYRVVNTSRLIVAIKAELKQVRKPKPDSTVVTLAVQHDISADLLRRLIESWGYLKKRMFSRRQVMQNVKVGIGIFNIHQLLVQNLPQPQGRIGESPNNEFNHISKYDIDISDVDSPKYDIWDSVYPELSGNTVSSLQNPANQDMPVAVDKTQLDKKWTLLNQSAEGFCLMCLFGCGDKLQVGELICVHNDKAHNGNNWAVGIIKWLKSYGKSGIEIGGQLLAPSAVPIGISSVKDKGDAIPTRGLLLPELANLNRPGSIICFSRLYRTGDILRIKQMRARELTIRLTRLIGTNNIISQFHYTLVGEDARPAHGDDDPTIEIDVSKFKDVWSNI